VARQLSQYCTQLTNARKQSTNHVINLADCIITRDNTKAKRL